MHPFGPNWQLGGHPYKLFDLLHISITSTSQSEN